jgi:hypothetical protein
MIDETEPTSLIAYIGKAAVGQDVWLVSKAKTQN